MCSMAQRIQAAPSAEPRIRPRVALVAAAIGALDVALVALLLFLDRVQVQSRQELARVELGLPLNWVTQNQRTDPPLPWRTGLLSPWENATTTAWLPLVLNVAIVGLLLTGVWAGVQGVHRGRTTK